MSTHNKNTHQPVFRKSLMALAMMGICVSATGQEAGPTEEDELEIIEVSGTRANLLNAQNIKRNSATVVDSITAADIGSLPDRSVLEAIQRLPGVSIELFAGPDDPDHFSVEGSGAVIRGLTQTRSEFNGRDSFSANSSRGLSFQDVSPELMGGVDVFKNQTADMIEGGIGGTISLRTRKPFDEQGQVFAFNLDYSYGSLAKEGTPTFSVLYSNRWQTDAGEFGFLGNYARSELVGETHGIQSDAVVEYYARDLTGAEEFAGSDNDGRVWVPQASNALKKTDEREREGMALALQFENNDETFLATFQYLRSDSNLAWNERAIKYQGGYQDIDSRTMRGLEGTEFTFDDRGVFESGTMVQGTDGWRSGDANANRIPRAWGDNSTSQWGLNTQMDSRVNETSSLVEDYSLNVKWQATENLELIADVQYIKADASNDDLAVHNNAWAIQQYDITGDTPILNLIEPWNGARDANPDAYKTYPDGASTDGVSDSNPTGHVDYPGFSGDPAGDSNYFADPASYWSRSAMDHYERSDGDSKAFRLDGTYFLDDAGMFTTVKAGVRYSKREQTVRRTGWNWGSLAPEWGADTGWLDQVDPDGSTYEVVDWSDFHGGGTVNISGNQSLHASESYIRSLMGANAETNFADLKSGSGSWFPYPGREEDPNFNSQLDDKYGIFSPGEINYTEETNKAYYVRLDFEHDDNVRFSGNIGLRYIELDRTSLGSVKFADLVPTFAAPTGVDTPLTPTSVLTYLENQVADGLFPDVLTALQSEGENGTPNNQWILDQNNYLTDEVLAYGDNSEQLVAADTTYSAWLPSFNVKFEVTDDIIARLGIAKAIAYPDMSDVRNRNDIGVRDLNVVRPVTPEPEEGEEPSEPTAEESLIQGVTVSGWTSSGGNPFLEPMESIQMDLALEWYFADVGQLSATLFRKNLDKFFIQGSVYQNITNPTTGVTQTVDVSTTRNGGKAKMNGIEVAYQQFFDMLPAPFDGLGLQATYTYIDASGVPNNEINIEDEDFIGDPATDTGIRVDLDVIPLQGQSRETANLVTMYEKDKWSARIAYNWRSRYLLTTRDVISKAPLWNEDRGQMDASVFYKINDNITVGIKEQTSQILKLEPLCC
ncbi:TonB-dependent receptor [Paraglaciecola aquimarina]|uniref:TonB-dependent receptor n=1 Tax=Paraglaciecola aquimarina TaxID=1235557 RepID=A0ABU3SRW7_9ALTE|nr:TonB-dependent receptor [Paraglaciecola aquimarina]MDU0352748.1 TonB-dependent receptor [Paraglaciecola aquimarina]